MNNFETVIMCEARLNRLPLFTYILFQHQLINTPRDTSIAALKEVIGALVRFIFICYVVPIWYVSTYVRETRLLAMTLSKKPES